MRVIRPHQRFEPKPLLRIVEVNRLDIESNPLPHRRKYDRHRRTHRTEQPAMDLHPDSVGPTRGAGS